MSITIHLNPRLNLDIHTSPAPNPYRYAIFSSRLQHSNLSVIHYSVFFQMCRAHGIGFDMKEKAGTIFCLVDSCKKEFLTMMVMSDDLQGSLSTFARNLSVIHQEISAPNMQGRSNFHEAINDIDLILGTTEENLKQLRDGKTLQLQAPRPKELQRILLEHQKSVSRDVQDKQMEEREGTPGDRGDNIEGHQRTSETDGGQTSSQVVRAQSLRQLSSTSVNIYPPPPSPLDVANTDDKTNSSSKDKG